MRQRRTPGMARWAEPADRGQAIKGLRESECQLDYPFSLNERPDAFLSYIRFLHRKQIERLLDVYISSRL